MDMALFEIFNGFAGKNHVIDVVAMLIAEYFPYVFSLILAYLWLFKSRWRERVLFAGYAAIIGLAANLLITLVYFHPRPFMMHAGTLLIPHASETSFPSDHGTLMCSVAFMLLTSHELRSSGATFVALSCIGGFARVYCGLHFPLDIYGSLLVAVCSTAVVYVLAPRLLMPFNRLVMAF